MQWIAAGRASAGEGELSATMDETTRTMLSLVLAGKTADEIGHLYGLRAEQVRWRLRRLMSQVTQDGVGRKPPALPEIGHARLAALQQLWQRKAAATSLPPWSSLRLTDLQPWISNIGLVEPRAPDRALKVRLVGRAVMDYDGTDFTGRYLDETVPEHAREEIVRPYVTCLRECRPQYTIFVPERDDLAGFALHRLLLPCASDGRNVDVVLVGIYLEHSAGGAGSLGTGTVYDLMTGS